MVPFISLKRKMLLASVNNSKVVYSYESLLMVSTRVQELSSFTSPKFMELELK
jgi:hypothetical protein